MTTAHRPTWYNAIGGENQGGNRKVSQTAKICSKDLPGHLQMKTRNLSDYVADKNIIKENLTKLENKENNKIRAIENIKNATRQEYSNLFPEDEDDEVEEDFLTDRKKKNKGKKEKGKGGTKERGKKTKHRYKGSDTSEMEKESDEDEEDQNKDSENEPTSDSNSSSSDSYSDSEQDEEEKELLRELENLRREKIEKEKREKEEQEKLKKKKITF